MLGGKVRIGCEPKKCVTAVNFDWRWTRVAFKCLSQKNLFCVIRNFILCWTRSAGRNIFLVSCFWRKSCAKSHVFVSQLSIQIRKESLALDFNPAIFNETRFCTFSNFAASLSRIRNWNIELQLVVAGEIIQRWLVEIGTKQRSEKKISWRCA